MQVGPLQCNCTLLWDDSHPHREAVIVDPGDEAMLLTQTIDQLGVKITAVLHTHAHIDHVGASAGVCQHTQAKSYLHPQDNALYAVLAAQALMLSLPSPQKVDMLPLEAGMQIPVGRFALEVLHTPGHSPGSVSFYAHAANLCLTGDALFYQGVGRTDLWGGNQQVLRHSISQILFDLPQDCQCLPGHGPVTTIVAEKKYHASTGYIK